MPLDATRFAVLRDRQRWEDGRLAGLAPEPDGALVLARVPSPAAGAVHLPGPYAVEPSGLALGSCRETYLVDTDRHRVVVLDHVCEARRLLPGRAIAGSAPGQLDTPRAVLVGPPGGLYVADTANARVQLFRLPTLELRAIWSAPLLAPVGLAADGRGRVYVLDRGLGRVLRFGAWGQLDDACTGRLATALQGTSPAFLAVAEDGTLYVSDAAADRVLRFDPEGGALAPLPAAPAWPRALAVGPTRLYVADASSGSVWAFDLAADAYLGELPGFRGPVAGMALNLQGGLVLKTGQSDQLVELQADAAHVSAGSLVAGPLDAGELAGWERIRVEAAIPARTTALVETVAADDPSIAPLDSDWAPMAALDAPLPTPNLGPDGRRIGRRFLFVRVTLRTAEPARSPRLQQVEAETAAESYRDYLPAVYARRDERDAGGFLRQLLALVRSELGAAEHAADEIHRWFDPATAPDAALPWLASWLAFDPPADLDARALRPLLARVWELYGRRGTPAGLRQWVELYAGVRPLILEAFRTRRLWQLDHTSSLGLDTMLAPATPDGMHVPGFVVADSAQMGLLGSYYAGRDFDRLVLSRVDPRVDFDWHAGSPAPGIPSNGFSVRWTGQLLPRYSETYTLETRSDDGVRLWIDGRLLIDDWHEHAERANTARVELEAGRWYPLRLDYYERSGVASVRLAWSSRSQTWESVPQRRLYALWEDTVSLARPSSDAILVGDTVVGQGRPQAAGDFGAAFFGDTAHLFGVLVPGASVPEPERRQLLRQVVEAEKPAHADYHLCFVEPRMRVGFQAHVGVDTFVAGPPDPMPLAGSVLGLDSVLGGEQGDRPGRVGQRARVGRDTVIG